MIETMNEQTGLQARYDALEAERASLNPDNSDDRFRISILDNEMLQLKAQLNDADRLQRQAEEVADVQLPEDYDERWGVVGANDEIRSLIQQTKEFVFSQHNDELAAQADAFKERIKAAEQQVETLTQSITCQDAEITSLTQKLTKCDVERLQALDAVKEAESKRDNAVRVAEEAESARAALKGQCESYKAQIDELEGMLRTYRSRSTGGVTAGLVLTSTLKPETDEQRAERLKREKLEQLNRQLQSRGMPPLSVPPAQSGAQEPEPEEAPESAPEAVKSDDRFPADEDALDPLEGQSIDGAVEGPPETFIKRIQKLEERVTRLEQMEGAKQSA